MYDHGSRSGSERILQGWDISSEQNKYCQMCENLEREMFTSQIRMYDLNGKLNSTRTDGV